MRTNVAEHGIAEVANVGRLIRVDVGMLDDNLAFGRQGRIGDPGEQGDGVFPAIQAKVQEAVARDFKRFDVGQLSFKRGGEIARDCLRRFLERAREREGNGQRDLAKLRLARLLHHHGHVGIKITAERFSHRLLYLLFNPVKHKIRV